VQARPRGFDAGDKGGVYMWHDDGGWHVRVTTRDAERVFSGTITTPGEIAAERVLDERGDRVAVSPDITSFGSVSELRPGGRRRLRDSVCAPPQRERARRRTRAADEPRVPWPQRHHPTSVPFVIERSY